MSPFNAWVLIKGLETIDLRVRRMGESCLVVARTLEEWQRAGRGIRRVVHPFLESHPSTTSPCARWTAAAARS